MKKISIAFFALLFAICLTCFLPQKEVFAKTSNESTFVLGQNAVSCVLADGDTGYIIYQKNATDKRPIASMTKIMTLLVIYDNINAGKLKLDDEVTVSQTAAGMGGSQAFLDAQSVHKVGDLIKTIVVASANDSCVALAEHLYGDVENFVSEMNKKALQLDLKATNFVNCTGLPALNQYSCAIDCVKMFFALIHQNNNYFDYSTIWMDDFQHPSGRITSLTNTNKLVKFYEGCDGGKTGYTNEAHHCLCATAKRGDTRLIACVLAEPDSKTRFAEVSQMFNYGFANFNTKVYLNKETVIETKINNGKSKVLEVKPQNNLTAFLKKGETGEEISVVTEFNKTSAPFYLGETVGTAFLIKKGEVIAQTPLISTMDVKKKSYFDSIEEIIKQW